MVNLVVSIGSNCGDRKGSVAGAKRWLQTLLLDFRESEIYETPCALREGPNYANSVVSGIYIGSLSSFEEKLKNYEISKGRDEACRKKGDVPVDIDVVIADGKILKPWDYKQKFFQIGFGSMDVQTDPD